MLFAKPEFDAIRDALRRAAPRLADAPIAFLAEGWEFWAFRAGDHVLRFPKGDFNLLRLPRDADYRLSLRVERALLPALAGRVSTPLPRIDVYAEDGPNGAPFIGHTFLPGELVLEASRPPAAGFGRDFGRLLRELHAFPAQQAVDLGVPLVDGSELRRQRAEHYEEVIRGVFPLVSCEARTRVEQVYEAYLNDTPSFAFEPKLVHGDLDVNTLIDAATGDLCGVIDFGGAIVSSEALDLWLPLAGFERLGISGQLPACLDEAALRPADVTRMAVEVAFLDFRFPLLDLLHGIETGDDHLVEEAIGRLNAALPLDLVCPD